VTMTTVGYGDKAPKTAAGRVVAVLWMASALFIVQPVLAASDLCYLGSLAANKSEKQLEELYERRIEGQLLTGRGKVLSIYHTSGEGLDGKYEVEIACSPKVLVKLQTNGFAIERFGAAKGVIVSFRGECFKIHKSAGVIYMVVRAVIR